MTTIPAEIRCKEREKEYLGDFELNKIYCMDAMNLLKKISRAESRLLLELWYC